MAVYASADDDDPADNELKITGNPGDPGSSLENPLAVSVSIIGPDLRLGLPRVPITTLTSTNTLASFQSTEDLEQQQARTTTVMRSVHGQALTDVKPLHWKNAKVKGSCGSNRHSSSIFFI